MKETCSLQHLHPESDIQYFKRCNQLKYNEDWVEHYYEKHIVDDKDKTDLADNVDVYKMGVGENWRITGSFPTEAIVVTKKGMKNVANRKCMIYFGTMQENKQHLGLMARYAIDANINMISVDYRLGPYGFLNAVSIVRDIGM